MWCWRLPTNCLRLPYPCFQQLSWSRGDALLQSANPRAKNAKSFFRKRFGLFRFQACTYFGQHPAYDLFAGGFHVTFESLGYHRLDGCFKCGSSGVTGWWFLLDGMSGGGTAVLVRLGLLCMISTPLGSLAWNDEVIEQWNVIVVE